ncbi:MAG: PEP-CTERM sorting domain-containing protein, partial [Pseudomonadota bacterium]
LISNSHAALIYQVSDTSVVNCTDSPHGLWTNNSVGGGSCSNYFSISGLFTVDNSDADSDNWTGSLVATATNPQNVVANINLSFTGFLDALSAPYDYKQEGGAAYNAATMDFFTGVSGSIGILGTDYSIDSFVNDYTFQFGLGANAKNASEYGGSGWIQGPNLGSHHWDLNLTFAKVPEPGIFALFGLGLLGLGLARRRAKA